MIPLGKIEKMEKKNVTFNDGTRALAVVVTLSTSLGVTFERKFASDEHTDRWKVGMTIFQNEDKSFTAEYVELRPNTPLGEIIDETFSGTFWMRVVDKLEEYCPEFGFVKTVYGEVPYYGQVIWTKRPADSNKLHAFVEIMKKKPKTAFKKQLPVYKATSDEIIHLLNFDKTGYYIGKILNQNIPVLLNSEDNESNAFAGGVNVFGQKGSGKTVGLRVCAEEKASHNEAVLIIDSLGDMPFCVPNSNGEWKAKMDEFNVEPCAFPSFYLSADAEKNPFSNAVFNDARVFNNPTFYSTFIKRGTITTISFKGLEGEDRILALTNIANTTTNLAERGLMPSMLFAMDEAHELAAEGMKTDSAKIALVNMCKRAGHYKIHTMFATQRKASITKQLTAPQNAWIVYSLQDPNDIKALPENIQHYKRLIQTLPVGTALLAGLTSTLLPVSIRPPKTKHFRFATDLMSFARENPQYTKTDEILTQNEQLQKIMDRL